MVNWERKRDKRPDIQCGHWTLLMNLLCLNLFPFSHLGNIQGFRIRNVEMTHHTSISMKRRSIIDLGASINALNITFHIQLHKINLLSQKIDNFTELFFIFHWMNSITFPRHSQISLFKPNVCRRDDALRKILLNYSKWIHISIMMNKCWFKSICKN